MFTNIITIIIVKIKTASIIIMYTMQFQIATIFLLYIVKRFKRSRKYMYEIKKSYICTCKYVIFMTDERASVYRELIIRSVPRRDARGV